MDISCDLERTIHARAGGPTVLAVRCAQRGVGDERPDLSIAAVIDRSTSMRGPKLDQVKLATRRLVEELGPRDRLVIVAFDSETEVIAAAPVVNKDVFFSAIDELEVRNGTNISGGLTTARDFLRADESGNVRRILLLTDGEASAGVTAADGLESIARDIVKDEIATTCLGFGAQYDEDVLGRIAGAGGGRLHHVKERANLAAVFEAELGRLRTMVARWIEIALVPAEGARVLGARNSYPTRRTGASLVLSLSELRAGEAKVALFDLLVPSATTDEPEDRKIGDVRLRWQDAKGDLHDLGLSVLVHYADDETAAKAEANGEVQLEIALLDAARAKERALADADAGEFSQGSARLEQSIRIASATPVFRSPDLKREIERMAQLAAKLARGRLEAEERKEVREEVQEGTYTVRRMMMDMGDAPPLPGTNKIG